MILKVKNTKETSDPVDYFNEIKSVSSVLTILQEENVALKGTFKTEHMEIEVDFTPQSDFFETLIKK